MHFYILDDNNMLVEVDCATQARWQVQNFQQRCVVARTTFGSGENKIVVSTVFLGIDHCCSIQKPAPRLVFETMVFGGESNESMERYST